MAKQATKQAVAQPVQQNSTARAPTQEEVAVLAYSLWQARGCPVGTPDEDWFSAESRLKVKTGP